MKDIRESREKWKEFAGRGIQAGCGLPGTFPGGPIPMSTSDGVMSIGGGIFGGMITGGGSE